MKTKEVITPFVEEELTLEQARELIYIRILEDKDLAEDVAAFLNPGWATKDLAQNLKGGPGEHTEQDEKNLNTVIENLVQGKYVPKIFEGKNQDRLIGTMNEGKLKFNGKSYTFVSREGIPESFGGLENVRDFSDPDKSFDQNRKGATIYFKELFSKYNDPILYPQYSELFDIYQNWYRVPGDKMSPMIKQWAQDNNNPYAGWYNFDGRHGIGEKLYAYLPVRVAGKFAYVWSNLDDEEEVAGFGCSDGEGFLLSISFMN